ncbi:putative spermidine/putrescine transport system permease protein [Rhodoligotrophos appendicifer]|uniref:ABC transporter permease n=1 Tax=Rhodoligotrophos appendicifer TaxID=987056 RepID=UPI001185A347|nr:ABC transporter permease [Rhodoligotrophos appendicifer]
MSRRALVEWGLFVAPLPVVLVIAYLVPLLGIFQWSFTDPQPGIGNYVKIATDPIIHSIAWRTLRICLLVTVVSVAIAYLISYHWVFGPPWRQRLIEVCVLIPFWISVLIRAFGWVIVLRPRGLVNEWLMTAGLIAEPLALVRNEIGVVIGMVHFMVPFAIFPLMAVMRQIDPRVMAAARGLGAWPIRRFVEVFLPLSLPGIVGAFFIVFIFALGFFITPAILGGGRVVMIAEYVFLQMSQTANWGLGAALSVVLLVFVSIMIWVLLKITRVEKLVG